MVKKTTKAKDKSQEFEEKMKCLEFKGEVNQKHHENKMEELKYSRDTDRLHHEREMERQRIRSAEIQRTIAAKDQSRRSYGYKA